jgi:chemotaxis protein MotB
MWVIPSLALAARYRCQGHTDDIPIAFSERFDSNWDLSAARAAAVADFFFANNEIDSERVSVFGYADTKPVADNSDACRAGAEPSDRNSHRRVGQH